MGLNAYLGSIKGPPAAGAGSGTVTSVGLSLPAEFTLSGSPVTTSGTLTGVWASQTASKVFRSGDAGGTPGFSALTAADIPNLSGAKITSGLVATARLQPAGSDTYIQYNSAGAFGADAGFTYVSPGKLTITPTGMTDTALKINLPALYNAATALLINDSAGKYVFSAGVSTSGNSSLIMASPSAVAAGVSSTSNIFAGSYPYQLSGNQIFNIVCTAYGSGTTFNPAASISFTAAENHSGAGQGTDISFVTAPIGGTVTTNRMTVTANGNVVTNATTNNLVNTATDGFLYIPFGTTVPTGVPTSYVGAVPIRAYQTGTTYRLYMYLNGGWRSVALA